MKLTSLLKKKTQNKIGEDVPPAPALVDTCQLSTPDETSTAALKLLTDSLSEVMDDLNQLIEGSEADFVLLGICLRAVHSNVTDLTQLMFETIKRMGTDEKDGLLDKVQKILDASLNEIQVRKQAVKGNLERITTVIKRIEDLHAISKQIKKFATSLKIVALNMLMEDAMAIDTSVNIFSDVAREIKELSINISRIANDVYSNVEKAREIHSKTRQKISDGINRLESLTLKIRATVRESSEALIQLSENTAEQTGALSQDISQQVAEIVVGIQFHDNMKQRLVHLVDKLRGMAASAETNDEIQSSEDMVTAPATVIIKEQVSCLEEIVEEVDDVYHSNISALQKISREVATLLRSLHSMILEEDLPNSNIFIHAPFIHLKDALTQLQTLLGQGETLYRQLQEAAENVSGIATNLSVLLNIVRSISANTHNKAINAMIAADHQGAKAGAMKLLAKKMNELANQSDAFSNEVEGIVTDIIDTTSAITCKEENELSEDWNEDDTFSRLTQVMNSISEGYDDFRENSQKAYHRAEEFKKATDTTISSLIFFTGLTQKLIHSRDQLANLTEQPDLKNIRVVVNTTGDSHVPTKHDGEGKNNVILFEDAKDGMRSDGSDGSLSYNVELF